MFSVAISRMTPPPWPPMPMPAMFSFSLGGVNPLPEDVPGHDVEREGCPGGGLQESAAFHDSSAPPVECASLSRPTEHKAAVTPGQADDVAARRTLPGRVSQVAIPPRLALE